MNDLLIDGNSLKIEDIININDNNICVILSEDARIKMLKSREVVEKIIDNNDIVYGINTGFGSLSSVTIDSNSLGDLQTNLVRSHACGVGKKMKPEHVIMMMLIRANSISKGYSGTRIDVVNLLISMINKNIAPVIPRIGSLGASGDLAPLSHLALAMIGEGDCMIKSEKGLWI
ncbi:MAG: aromatic amino acid lyase, partial [Candidatus Poseidoniales archaeon]